MQVALFGGTGFVGGYLVDELLAGGHIPSLLVRPGSEGKVTQPEKCAIHSGTIADQEAIEATLQDCQAIIYNIGVIREFPKKETTFELAHHEGVKKCVDAALKLGVRRFVLMSANGVKSDGTAYQRTKFEGEEYLRHSGLDWTIFRPSMIFGDPRGRLDFATILKRQIVDLPLPAPLFFPGLSITEAGQFRFSPVHVKDVAAAFIRSLTDETTFNRTIVLAGPESLTWKSVIKRIALAGDKNKWTVPVPVLLVKSIAALFDRFEWFPITRTQITMLLEGNTGSPRELSGLIEKSPTCFNRNNLTYLKTV
ncbi:MAG: NAD(P)H-binding protein [FCB group bacterium]|nr:NAD(P)H-binding protein [FCB group bacterium]